MLGPPFGPTSEFPLSFNLNVAQLVHPSFIQAAAQARHPNLDVERMWFPRIVAGPEWPGSGGDGLRARNGRDRRRWAQRADASRRGKGGGAAVPLCDKKSHDGWLRVTIDLRVRRALENGACSSRLLVGNRRSPWPVWRTCSHLSVTCHIRSQRTPGKEARKRPFNPARMAHSRFSSMRLFTTENTPLTPFACTSAMLLSPPLFTTPSSVTLPFCTMM